MNYKRAAKDKRTWGLRLGKKLWEIRNEESTTYGYPGDNRKLLILHAVEEYKISKITAERWQARYVKVKP